MKKITPLLLMVIFIPLFNLSAYALEALEEPTEISGEYGAEDIVNALPEEARSVLDENNITPENSGAASLTVKGVLTAIKDMLLREVTKPLKFLASVTGIILLCALAETLRDSGGTSQAVKTFELVGVLAGAGMMCGYITEAVIRAGGVLQAAGAFLLTFIPVFAGIMAITGQITTAGVFNGVTVAAAQVFGQIMSALLVPLSASILGIATAGAASPDIKTERLASAVKKIVIWTLGFLTTIFTGLLSVQSLVTNSADTVAMKAVKFTVSGSVPFVGGTVSDSLGVVKSSLDILKSSTGTFGIIAGVVVCLPALISVLCYRLALTAAGAVSDLFGVRRLSSLIKSGESIMSIILAMLVCFMLLTVVSIALMLKLGGNGA